MRIDLEQANGEMGNLGFVGQIIPSNMGAKTDGKF